MTPPNKKAAPARAAKNETTSNGNCTPQVSQLNTWRDELGMLAMRHSSLGISPDLVNISVADAFGLLLYLRGQ